MTSSKKSGIRRSDKAQAILREAGYIVTDEGVERMRQRLLALDRLQAQDIESGVPEGRDLNLRGIRPLGAIGSHLAATTAMR